MLLALLHFLVLFIFLLPTTNGVNLSERVATAHPPKVLGELQTLPQYFGAPFLYYCNLFCIIAIYWLNLLCT